MAAALRLSRWHTGLTATNPSVGCLVVKDGAIVGSAVTAPGGRPHAETQALGVAGEKARGATLYVTLEPCSHHGKTPPCADAIVAAGISRVVVSLTDPDPRVSGRGLAIQRDAGIGVESGLMEEEGRRALQAYLMRQTRGRPYVTLKIAVSADGMIGRQDAGQVAITGPAARAQVHALRAEMDAILVGIGTALADDPQLTCRAPGLEARSPVRIVLDRRLELPLTSKLVRTAREVPVMVVAVGVSSAPPSAMPDISPSRGEVAGAPAHPASGSCGDEHHHSDDAADSTVHGEANAHAKRISPLEGEISAEPTEGGGSLHADISGLHAAGVEILETESLHTLLNALAARGLSSLLVEGGAVAAKSFLDADLIDRILLFESDVVVGEGGIESPFRSSDMPASMPEGFRLVRSSSFGADRVHEYERSS